MSKQFTMSMYANAADLYKAKCEYLEECIDWALRANRTGAVGFVPNLLRGLDDLETPVGSEWNLRQYIEAVEKADGITT